MSDFFESYFADSAQPTFLDGAYRVIVCDRDELPDALHDDWNRLAGERPFGRWEWLVNWWNAYRSEGLRACVAVVCDDANRVVGIAPWYVGGDRFQGSVLRFLGDNSVCTDFQDILCAPGKSEDVVAALADWLLGPAKKNWDALDLRGHAQGEPNVGRLAESLRRGGATIHPRPLGQTWRVELPATWDLFLRENLSRKRRDKVRELEKKYIRKERAVLHTLEREEDFEAAFATLRTLHASRRNSIGDAGCFADETFTRFQRTAMLDMLAQGSLSLQTMELDGTPAASIYAIRGGDGFYQYQSGMDASRAADQPGWLAIGMALKAAIESGAKFWDFMRGDEPYKASWGAQPTRSERLRIAAPGRLGALRARTWTLRDGLRDWWKGPVETPATKPQIESPAATTNIADASAAPALAHVSTTRPNSPRTPRS